MGSAFSLANLRELGDEGLIALHDEVARHTQVGVDYYLDELWRRETARQTNEIVGLTRAIKGMTLVMMIATILNVILFAWSG